MTEPNVNAPNDPVPASSEPQAGDPNLQTTPPEGGSPSETAPSPTTPGGSLHGAGLRYGDGDPVPDWAKGRTADEILETANQLYAAIQSGTPAQPTAPTPATPPPPSSSPVDPNLMYSNPHEYDRQLRESIRTEMRTELASAANSVTSPMASMAKEQAKTHRPKVWDRYGPEIETTMAQLGPNARADVSSWKRVINYVAGEHVDELADARAKEILARGGDSGSLPTHGGPPNMDPASGLSPIRKLFAENHPAVDGYQRDRIPVEKVIAHALKRGHTEEGYAEMLEKNTIRRAGATT